DGIDRGVEVTWWAQHPVARRQWAEGLAVAERRHGLQVTAEQLEERAFRWMKDRLQLFGIDLFVGPWIERVLARHAAHQGQHLFSPYPAHQVVDLGATQPGELLKRSEEGPTLSGG